jgi:hypothetical protein
MHGTSLRRILATGVTLNCLEWVGGEALAAVLVDLIDNEDILC